MVALLGGQVAVIWALFPGHGFVPLTCSAACPGFVLGKLLSGGRWAVGVR
jgi:hypothetical protein